MKKIGSFRLRRVSLRTFSPILLCCFGCGATDSDGIGPVLSGAWETAPKSVSLDVNPFEAAEAVALAEDTPVVLNAHFESGDAVVVYNLGAVAAGEGITVRKPDIAEGYVSVAFFDDQYDLLALGALWAPDGIGYRTNIECPVSAASEAVYLALSVPDASVPADLSVEVVRGPGAGTPPVAPRDVVLDFQGANNVTIGLGEPMRIPPFNAADVSSRFEGMTEEITAMVEDFVREDFEALGIAVHNSAGMTPDGREAPVVYIGPADIPPAGAAGGDAVVDTAGLYVFESYHPGSGQLARVIANVVSHEAGHLFGLNHTTDPNDIMQPTGSFSQLLIDRSFRHAPLAREVFPIGAQDGAKWIVARTAGGGH